MAKFKRLSQELIKYKILLVLFLVLTLLGCLFFYRGSIFRLTGSSIHTVVLKGGKFFPAELTIRQGDTVVFTTIDNRQFWPASDFHPTHLLYPEFDPKKPILANSSWSFTFTKVGKWTYHNHLLPSEGGTIIVLDKNGSLGKEAQAPCDSNSDTPQCWSEIIGKTLDKQGLPAAFSEVEQLYSTKPAFAHDCHAYAHQLGETAYSLFSEHKDIPLSSAASLCGYGFYHGFMEELLLNTNDMKLAGNFCSSIYKQQSIISGDACFHGVGHGAEALAVSDPSLWTDPKAMFSKASSICQAASGSDQTRFSRCASGIFMEAASYYSDGTYNLKYDKSDPFSICSSQEDKLKMDCYTQLYPVLISLTSGSFTKAATFIEQIKEDNYAEESIETLSGAMVNVQVKDHSKDVAACRSLQARLGIPCIKGLALGFLLNSQPGTEFESTSYFCSKNGLSDNEKKSCYDIALSQMSGQYPSSQVQQYCTETPYEYRTDVCK